MESIELLAIQAKNQTQLRNNWGLSVPVAAPDIGEVLADANLSNAEKTNYLFRVTRMIREVLCTA